MTRDPFPQFPDRRRIGEGGIADVFSATWQGRAVALKVLREGDRPGLRQRFLREGRLLGRIRHTGLVQCLAVLDGDPAALVLELLLGEPLDRRISRGPLDPATVTTLASSLLQTLAHLHEHGIVHRDIKASNVWLGSDGRVVLMDLGLAADTADPLTTTLGEVVGTHAYMAPEQIAGAECDHRCDLYSLGVTLYEALCGVRPYQARGLAGYLAAHRSGRAVAISVRLPMVPKALAGLVDRLMAGDPARRPATARVALALLSGAVRTGAGLRQPPLVGRGGTRGAIEAVLDGGGILRVRGEIGSGLGAVARLAADLARAAGVECVVLRCRPRTAVADLVAQLAVPLDRTVGPIRRDAAGVLAAVDALVAETGRFLLVVEDLDLAGASAVAWVVDLAHRDGVSAVLLGNALGEEVEGREHVLRPITVLETRRLVAAMLGVDTPPDGLHEALHRVCGGQSSLLVALLRHLVAEGVVWTTPGGWEWDALAPLTPGPDVARDFHRATAGLPEPTQRILAVLATAGAPLPMDVVLRAAGGDPSGVELGPALRVGLAGIDVVDGTEWVRLRRAIHEPLLLDVLSEADKREVHGALAAALRAVGVGESSIHAAVLHEARAASTAADAEHVVAVAGLLLADARPDRALESITIAGRLPLEDGRSVARRAAVRADALLESGRLTLARDALRAARAFSTETGGGPSDLALIDAGLASASGHRPSPSLVATVDTLVDDDPLARVRLADHRWRTGELAEASLQYRVVLAFSDATPRARFAAQMGLARVGLHTGDIVGAVSTFRAVVDEARASDRPALAASALCGLAEALRFGAHLAAAEEALRIAGDLVAHRQIPWAEAEIALTRTGIRLAVGDATAVAGWEVCGDAGAPWEIQGRFHRRLAIARAVARDTPAALAAHLRGAEVADTAGDVCEHAFHTGMAALLVGDADSVSTAVDALAEAGSHWLLAKLLAAGSRVGHDDDVLAAAEVEARAAGDLPLLLQVLHLNRGPGSREEARGIVQRLLDGLFGPLRLRCLDAPPVRWALGEPSALGRDTTR